MGKLFRRASTPLLIADRLFDVSEVANTLLNSNGSTYWIEFEESGLDGLTRSGWGFGRNFNLTDLVEAVRFHSSLVHPSLRPTLVLTRVQYALQEVETLLSIAGNLRHTLVIEGSELAISSLAANSTPSKRVSRSELGLTAAEVADCLGVALGTSENNEIGELVGESYESVGRIARERLGLPPLSRTVPRQFGGKSGCITKQPFDVLRVLVNNRQWTRALDIAVATDARTDLLHLVDMAGEEAIHFGRLEAFRRRLESLSGDLQKTDVVLYWFLVTEVSLGLDSGIFQEIQSELSRRQLPRVQVFGRVLGLDLDATHELEVSAEGDLTSEMYLAHLQAFDGNPDGAISSLRRLLNHFSDTRNAYRVVQTMLLMTNSLVLNGNYKSAMYWGEATRKKALELGAADLEVAAASASSAYATLLAGTLARAADNLGAVYAERFLGMPYSEGIVSTMADCFASSGHFQTALEWYELAVNNSPVQVANILMPDLALMLVRLGRPEEAALRAQAQLEAVDDSSAGAAWARLALAVANLDSGDNVSIELLEDLLRAPPPFLTGPYLARASILLGLLYFRRQQLTEAVACLNKSHKAIDDLSLDGWRLLSGNSPDVSLLYEFWRQSNTPLVIQFLGADKWMYREHGSNAVTSLRLKEVIFILSCFPGGISGDKLTTLMGLGIGARTTIRTHISRLRQFLPVNTNPYSISASIDADYLEVSKAIEQRDLETALERYRGPLLADSDIPYIREQRNQLEEKLRMLVVDEGTAEQVAEFALLVADDLALLEQARERLSSDSALLTKLERQICIVEASWQDDG